jgi:glycosyltransferase involved in cell wall biosynthesis
VRPAVSAIVPVHDNARYLTEALDSIDAQSYEPLELVVVDDGSTDGSADIARERADRLVELTHGGVAHARNAGVAAACGELIAFLDGDDIWTTGALETRVRHLEQNPETGFVLGRMQLFLDPHSPPPTEGFAREMMSRPQAGFLQTFVGRREVFEAVGGFDETLVIAEDTDWLKRASDAGVVAAHVDEVFALKRLHPESLTARHGKLMRPLLMKVLRDSVDRRRTGAAK